MARRWTDSTRLEGAMVAAPSFAPSFCSVMLFILISGSARWFASFSLSLFLSLSFTLFFPPLTRCFSSSGSSTEYILFKRTQSIPPKAYSLYKREKEILSLRQSFDVIFISKLYTKIQTKHLQFHP